MYRYFRNWVEEQTDRLVELGIRTDTVNVVMDTANPSTTVDHSSSSCMGRVSVWQSGLMDAEILHCDTGRRLLYKHHQLNGECNFNRVLKKYLEVMSL